MDLNVKPVIQAAAHVQDQTPVNVLTVPISH